MRQTKLKTPQKSTRTFIIVIEYGISKDVFSVTKQLLNINFETEK